MNKLEVHYFQKHIKFPFFFPEYIVSRLVLSSGSRDFEPEEPGRFEKWSNRREPDRYEDDEGKKTCNNHTVSASRATQAIFIVCR